MTPVLARAEDDKLTPAEPLEVIVQGKPNEPDTFSSARAASRVTEGDIRMLQAGSIADALRGRAGVGVQQTTPGQGTIYVRGLSSREVLHMVDGVPLNAAIFRAGNNPYLGLIDPLSIREIEVIRGSSSVLHATDALGGVVAVATALPGYSLVPGGVTRVRAFQGLTVNPLGSSSRASVEHSAARWAAYVGLSYVRAGDIRPGGGEPTPVPSSYLGLERAPESPYSPLLSTLQQGTGFEMIAANVALRARLSRTTEVVIRGQLGVRPELVRYDEVTPRFKLDFPARAESSVAPMVRAMTSAVLSYRPSSSSIVSEVIVQAAWQRLQEGIARRNLGEQCFEGGLPVDSDPCRGVFRLVPKNERALESNRSDALSARGEARLRGRIYGVRLGAEVSHDIVSSRAEALDLSSFETTPAPERFPNGSSMTQAGIYGMVEVTPVPGLRVYAGARGALFHLAIKGRAVEDPGGSPAFTRTVVDVALNAGAKIELSSYAAIVANVGRGVRAPNVQDFSGLGARAKGRFQLPNPAVRPEHTLSLDTGIKAKKGLFSAEAYVFYLRYMDAITLAPAALNGATETPAGERYERSENAARVDYVGVESMFTVPFARFIGIDGHALAMMGTQHNEPKTGLPPVTPADRTPPVTATLGLWADPIPTLRIEAIAYGRFAQRRLNDPTNLDDNRIPAGGTPGFVSLRLQGTWHVRRNITARVAIDNLTDALILEHGSGFYRPGINGSMSLDATF